MIITATRGLLLVLSGHFSDEDRVLFGHQKKTERITKVFTIFFSPKTVNVNLMVAREGKRGGSPKLLGSILWGPGIRIKQNEFK